MTVTRDDETEVVRFGVRFQSRNAQEIDRALTALNRLGFETVSRGLATASMRGPRAKYQALQAAPPDVATLIAGVAVQRAHAYLTAAPLTTGRATPASLTPARLKMPDADPPSGLKGYYLTVPEMVAEAVRADKVHNEGITGKGVRIAVVDSGFYHEHPFFTKRNYTSTVVLAGAATNEKADENGHGTAISSNVFAIAPGVTFIGVKLEDRNEPSTASILEGLHKAMEGDEKPRIISLSVGFNLTKDGKPLETLDDDVKTLAAEISAIVEEGTIVVAASGNGQFFFPAQMPDVIAVGGVYVDDERRRFASDLASGYKSRIYPNRRVPDICGLVGMASSGGWYIAMPVQPGSETDQWAALTVKDGTELDDGWAVFSGTSSAAAQVAAVCALLLEKEPTLTPDKVKARLMKHGRDVERGASSQGLEASKGRDVATGAGLVDAFRTCFPT